MLVYLDGNQFPLKEIDGIKNSKITFRDVDQDGLQAKGYAGQLKFTGTSYDYFYDRIINNPNGENVKIDILLIEDCCDDYEFFHGEIKGRDIEWCEGKCVVECTPIEKKETIDCIKSILISESNKTIKNTEGTGFETKEHPRVLYCVEMRPSFLQDLVLIFGTLFIITLYILYPIVLLMSILVSIICFVTDIVGGDCPDALEDGILNDYQQFIDFLSETIVGCGPYHPSPLVRDYITNVCDICGITFKSSILNDSDSPYYNLLYYNAPAEKGTENMANKMIGPNIPLMTLDIFLDSFKTVFNAKWILSGSTLIFERIDYFDTGNIWIDFTKIDPKRLQKQCYEFANDDLFAFASFEYIQDGVDWVGDEAKEYYSDIVEWNEPYNPIQKGQDKVILPFGYSRFRDDNIDVDVLGRDIYNIPILPFYSILQKSKDVLLTNNGTSFQPKLLIWDGASIDRAKIKRYSYGGDNRFNYPMVFEEVPGETPAQYVAGKLQMTDRKNMYHNFHQIRDPRLMAMLRRNVRIEFTYICEELKTANTNDNIILSVNGTLKQMKIDKIEVDPSKKKMLVTGKI